MLNFDLYNPTRVLFGKGRIAHMGQEIPDGAKVLITYGGGSVKRHGVLDEVRRALSGHDLVEFGGIEPNPCYETLMECVQLVRSSGADFLVAIGGGSVIDGTKFVAAASAFEGDPWDILVQRGANVRAALPFGCVLTLPATGSEMNKGAVITRKSLQAKLSFMSHHVFPRFSVLDPEKTYTLPARQIGNGVVDAFIHVLEQYLTYPVNAKVQDRFAEGLLLTLIEDGPKALENPREYDVRANLMLTATMALNGLIGSGVPQDWATHMIGHELTALYGMDHAQTLAVVLPGRLAVGREGKRDKLLQYAERVWGLRDGDPERRIDEAIERTRGFFETMGVRTRLSDYQVGDLCVPTVLGQLEAHGMTALGEGQDVTLEESRRILELGL